MATELRERDYSADERRAMAKAGQAMPDGSFPIKDGEDLQNAIDLVGHADDPAAARSHIKKRAAALGLSDRLPDAWKESDGNNSGNNSAHETTLREAELVEAVEVESDGRHVLEVTLIRSGTSKNGNHYPVEVLRESAGLFEGTRAFVDHPAPDALPERSVRDLVGYYRQAHLDENARIRAQLHLLPGNDWLFSLLKEASTHPELCGLSIDAQGDVTPRGGVNHVNALHKVSSVDIVTRPAAGGGIDRIIASDRPTHIPQERSMSEPTTEQQTENDATAAPAATAVQESQPVRAPSPAPGAVTSDTGATSDVAQLVEQLNREREDARRELERVQRILNPGAASPPDSSAEITRLAEEIKRERDLTRAEKVLDAKLREARLPDPVERKLRRRYEGRLFETSELEGSISDEKDTLAALSSAGHITGMGYEKPITLGMSDLDQVMMAFDGLFDIYESDAARSVPKLSGIREAFRLVTGIDAGTVGGADRPLRPELQEALRNKVQGGHLRESEITLREADVQTSTFSFLLGTSMNKRLLSDYQAWPSEWQKFTSIVGIKDFKQQDRIRLGAFGSLSTVAEDAAYTTVTLSDTRAIYTPTKRGNLVQITRETIVNDDLYAIKQIPQKLAVAAAFTLAEFVYNLLAPNFGNIYDAHPLFDSINHLNTGVIAANLNTANSGAALSSAALQTAVIKMRKQQNLASKPIGLKPRFLLVPPDLEFTAMTILKSAGLPGGNNNDINPMMGYAEPIVSPQLNSLTAGPASTTIWIAVADPRIIDTLEVGFVGGQANPVLLIQDMPLYGINFTQDVISYKVRHEYGGAVVDYRGFYLGNN